LVISKDAEQDGGSDRWLITCGVRSTDFLPHPFDAVFVIDGLSFFFGCEFPYEYAIF
jgi:hypothetical protein